MKLKRVVKVAFISVGSLVGALFVWVAVVNFLSSGRGNTEFYFTSEKWEFSLGEKWIMMNTNGQKVGTINKSKIGPILIEHYE